jgi:hypothetical protein
MSKSVFLKRVNSHCDGTRRKRRGSAGLRKRRIISLTTPAIC